MKPTMLHAKSFYGMKKPIYASKPEYEFPENWADIMIWLYKKIDFIFKNYKNADIDRIYLTSDHPNKFIDCFTITQYVLYNICLVTCCLKEKNGKAKYKPIEIMFHTKKFEDDLHGIIIVSAFSKKKIPFDKIKRSIVYSLLKRFTIPVNLNKMDKDHMDIARYLIKKINEKSLLPWFEPLNVYADTTDLAIRIAWVAEKLFLPLGYEIDLKEIERDCETFYKFIIFIDDDKNDDRRDEDLKNIYPNTKVTENIKFYEESCSDDECRYHSEFLYDEDREVQSDDEDYSKKATS